MTEITIQVETPFRKVGNLRKGDMFRHSGVVHVKTTRMVHEGTHVCSNSFRFKDGESVFLNNDIEVEVFSTAEIILK